MGMDVPCPVPDKGNATVRDLSAKSALEFSDGASGAVRMPTGAATVQHAGASMALENVVLWRHPTR